MISIGLMLLEQSEIAVSHTLHMILLFEADFLVGKKLQLPNFRDSLRERGTVQMLTIGREAAIEVQVGLFRVLISLCLLVCRLHLPPSSFPWMQVSITYETVDFC